MTDTTEIIYKDQAGTQKNARFRIKLLHIIYNGDIVWTHPEEKKQDIKP